MHRDLPVVEGARDALRLRQRVAQGAGALHLEGEQDDDAAFQLRERERLLRIEPLRDLELGGIFGIEGGGVHGAILCGGDRRLLRHSSVRARATRLAACKCAQIQRQREVAAPSDGAGSGVLQA